MAIAALFSVRTYAQAPPAGQMVQLPAVSNRVRTIDETQLVSLPGHVHPLAEAKFDQGVVEDNLPVEHLMVVLKRTPEQDAAAAVLVDQLHNRNSAQFHQWLTPDEFGQHFGPSDSDLQKLTNWLQAKGFTIDDVPPGRTHIVITGTAGQVRDAFHTELHNLNVNGEKHVAVLTEPRIPAALAPVIAGLHQLHDWRPKPLYHPAGAFKRDSQTGAWQKVSGPKSVPELTTTYQGFTYYEVGPQDWYTIYNSHPLYNAGITGAGTTIAVIEETEVAHQADVTSFRSQFGLPAYPNTPNSTQGGVNWIYGPGNGCSAPPVLGPDSDNEEAEALLDVEWAGTIAPNAIVDFVACNSTGGNIGSYGTDLAASYVANYLSSTVVAASLSYGECETFAGSSGALYYNNQWQQMAAEGITAVVSAGDAGSLTCDAGAGEPGEYPPNTSAMSSSAYDISAGGTDFSDYYQTRGYSGWWSGSNGTGYGSALSYVPEVTWNQSCADPLFASYLQYIGYTGYGNTYTPIAICNNQFTPASMESPVGGGGGISQYHGIPNWQGGVYGIGKAATSTSHRNEPDLSFFASAGWWGHFLPYCQSDAGYSCNYANASDAYNLGAGGTSFVAPQIAGLMALVNQKTGSRQGVANYTLYNLAAAEYGTASTPNYADLSNCSGSGKGAAVGSTCIFRDIANDTPSLQGGAITSDIVEPCFVGSDEYPAACYNGDEYEIEGLSTVALGSSILAYVTAPGYNDATGLGSANAYNLVTNWNTVVGFPTTTTLSASPTTVIAATATTTLTAMVVATGRGGQVAPVGIVSFYIGSAGGTFLGTSNLISKCSGSAGSTICTAAGTLTVYGSQLNSGSNSIVAHFGGDGANDDPSTSSAVNVTYEPGLDVPVLSWPAAGAFTYGTILRKVLPTSATYSGKSVAGTFSYTADGMPATFSSVLDVGTHTVVAVFTPTNTLLYASVQDSILLTVTPAPLTVAADNQIMFYEGPLPLLSCKVSGATKGDSFTCSATTNATASSPVGTYTITPAVSGLALPNYHVTLVDGTLSIVDPPVPVLNWLSPSDAVAGGNALTLTVNGSDFAETSTVLWNNSSRTTTYVSSTQLQAAITAADIATAGNAIVTVSTPAPGGGVSFDGMFSIQLSRIITTVAGNGAPGYAGDGGSATGAELSEPEGVVVDASGNLYIADASNNRVREVNAATGVITTVAGTGVAGYSGDSGPATSAELDDPSGVAVDAAGDLYIADTGNNRIREVSAKTGTITTVAGSGMKGYGGDSGLATSAELNSPHGVAINAAGNLYLADSGNNVIREVSVAAGIITTVAGNGTKGFSGDGSPATSAELYDPLGVAVDMAGNLYIADTDNQRIRKVDATTALITTVAGNGWGVAGSGYSGGNGPATAAGTGLWSPEAVAVDTFGNLYIADMDDHSVRQVDAAGIITTAAGNGQWGFSGDNGPAILAKLSRPEGLALDAFGNLYIADTSNQRIRKVAASSGAAEPATTTVLTATANPVAFASPVTFTATVTTTGSNVPTGSVAFYAGSIPMGMAELNSSGVGNYTASSLELGTYPITAFYSGDANDKASVSAPLSETILSPAGVPALTLLSPSSATAGGSTFTLTVTGSNFASTSTVLWNGSNCTTAYVSGTQLLATITTADIGTEGSAIVTVTTPAPGGGVSNGLPFTIAYSGKLSVPVLSWPGTGVIFYGANLSGTLPTSASYGGNSVAGTFSYTADGVPVTASTVLNAGTHTLAAIFTPTNTANYVAALGSIKLTVNPAPLTVTAANQSMTYGGTVPALACSVSGAVNGDTFTCSAATTSDPTAAASPFAIVPVALGPAIGNYTVTATDGTLTVNKAALTVTAQNAMMFAGDPLPSLMTYTITGFVNGDGPCVVSGDPAIGTAATSTSPTGSYAITVTPGNLAAANYKFTFVNGTLTIEPAL